ncbi:MAG: acetate/propionate family kinase [Sphingomonadales bacterium]|nr:acetate/propionate family kinase [Sphingomonadales bacterium]MBU3992311.1 acetate/propionate family kinase [Alphaproteobacteria bacterium]
MSAERGAVLVVNGGSSSIKFAIFGSDLTPVLHGKIGGIGVHPHISIRRADGASLADDDWGASAATSLGALIGLLGDWLSEHLRDTPLAAIGHRVAIGGLEHSGPVVLTPEVIDNLRSYIPLAPLHQPINLALIEAMGEAFAQVPQVACFDTAFHRTLPPEAEAYALPASLREAGASRYGFHGLSYEYIASQLARLGQGAATGRTVVAHLGSGASMCALQDGRSIATTMGFSPLSGLVMGTRSGDLDPGLMIWMIREQGLGVDQVERMLYSESGLKGLSGQTGDMGDLLQSDAPAASFAIDVFTYRVATALGSLCAALGGIDALIFTAGIGENSPAVRAAICDRAAWLGVRIDPQANEANAPCISSKDSAVSVWVLPTQEELMVARHTLRLVFGEGANSQRVAS